MSLTWNTFKSRCVPTLARSSSKAMQTRESVLSWEALTEQCTAPVHISSETLENGPATSYARLRLFGKRPEDVRVTLYRDNHAWCPYCEKVWLFLEEKRIPFQVKKVTMFCYGEKEAWYKQVVPSGMLPAVEIDGKMITESDDILVALESNFGVLYKGMADRKVQFLRKLERHLFRAWCSWLCYPSRNLRDDNARKEQFVKTAMAVEKVLGERNTPFFLEKFSIVDCIFTPYVERMNASLYYYKGFVLRDKKLFPNLCQWFDALEAREAYRGMQSDFHTHVHDLPPQMGGCYPNGTADQIAAMKHVDEGPWHTLHDAHYSDQGHQARMVALSRVLLHRENICMANPLKNALDEPLRVALTYMLHGKLVECSKNPEAATGLRYLRDRVNVPRDMPLWSARHFRDALEVTAKSLSGTTGEASVPIQHRRDQDPRQFFGVSGTRL